MSKKIISILAIALLYSCSSTKNIEKKPLYEVLLVNNDGGANIKFYEVLTEPKEIKMAQIYMENKLKQEKEREERAALLAE